MADLPKLPEGFFWSNLDSDGTTSIRVSENSEQVAWFYPPGENSDFEGKYECVSAPKGIFDSGRYYRAPADTEQEAIDLIVSFALLNIHKE